MRTVGFLYTRFKYDVLRAEEMCLAIERLRARASRSDRRDLSIPHVEHIYEAAFLIVFCSWEAFLEETLFRYMSGYSSANGRATMVAGAYYRDIGAARAAVYRGRQYLLWHNPRQVIDRSNLFVVNGVHNTVLNSAFADVEKASWVRHRIAHKSEDSKLKFDAATLHFNGRRYPGGNTGAFLRDAAPPTVGGDPQRRVQSLCSMLDGLASQIAP